MADGSSSSSSGIGFFGLLTILFVALKLLGVIDWSWWWVLSPIWGCFVFVVLLIVGIALTAAAVEQRNERKRRLRRW